MSVLLEVSGLGKDFAVRHDALGRATKTLRAVDDVSLTLNAGETLGIVGESGCGKTTLARLVLRLLEPSVGAIRFQGQDITHLPEPEMRKLRASIQVVFQDPYSSLNPRLRVRDIIAEPLVNQGWPRAEIDARINEVLEIVGLPIAYQTRYPHAFSGGQRQRIGIARALAPSPKLIVCDEAVSALDVSIQAQVLNLLQDIQRRFGLALLFISHNLAVVRHVSHRVAVMYLGRVVELASEADLFAKAMHPYTAALIAAVPEPDPAIMSSGAVLEGELPSPIDQPTGCQFHTRCPIARDRCKVEAPPFARVGDDRFARCHYPGEYEVKR